MANDLPLNYLYNKVFSHLKPKDVSSHLLSVIGSVWEQCGYMEHQLTIFIVGVERVGSRGIR